MVTKDERYLPDSVLLAMRRRGMTLHEICEANHRTTGFRPDRGNLSRLLSDLGAERRRSPVLLRHWVIMPQHNSSRWRHMLSAKSKELEFGKNSLSDAEKRAVSMLEYLLRPERARKKLVVAYHWQVGFCLVDALPGEEWIRVPENPEQDDRNGTRPELELVK